MSESETNFVANMYTMSMLFAECVCIYFNPPYDARNDYRGCPNIYQKWKLVELENEEIVSYHLNNRCIAFHIVEYIYVPA